MTLNEINSQPIEWMNQYNILWYLKSARWWLAFWLGEYSNLGLSQRYRASNGRDGEDDACCQALYEQTRPPLRSSSASASRSSTDPKSCCFYLLCPLISILILFRRGYITTLFGVWSGYSPENCFYFLFGSAFEANKNSFGLCWIDDLCWWFDRGLYIHRGFPQSSWLATWLLFLSFFLFYLFLFFYLEWLLFL